MANPQIDKPARVKNQVWCPWNSTYEPTAADTFSSMRRGSTPTRLLSAIALRITCSGLSASRSNATRAVSGTRECPRRGAWLRYLNG